MPAGVGLRRAGVGAARWPRCLCASPALAVAFRRWRREAAADGRPDRRRPRARRRRAGQSRTSARRARPVTMPMNPDRLAELEDERRFLLRSLRDLDAEHDAGDVDEDDYATLRDGYTKRAADVLREHRGGPGRRCRRRGRRCGRGASRRRRRGRRRRRRPGGWSPARRVSGSAGETITGGAPSDDVAVLLAEARALLGHRPARRPGAVRAGARASDPSSPRR